MNKISLFLSLLLAFAGATKAQVLVKDAATELTDGTVIALQCRDNNGGAGYFFKGATTKTPELTAENLYVVCGNADGLKLRNFSTGQYIGQTNGNDNVLVTNVDDADAAITFTAKSYGIPTKANNADANFSFSTNNVEMEGTVHSTYVRFSLAAEGDGRFLNTNNDDLTPKLYSGTGGYSVWYVYKFFDTVKDAAKELVDGTIVALQCRDYHGGAGYFFKGATAKTPELTAENLYVVCGNTTDGFKLRNLLTREYIGQVSGDNNVLITNVDDAAAAITFTAGSNPNGGRDTQMEGTINDTYVRFSLMGKNENRFLNTNDKDLTPKLFTGNGGYSVWYVYRLASQKTGVNLCFNRTSNTPNEVAVYVKDLAEKSIENAEATFSDRSNITNENEAGLNTKVYNTPGPAIIWPAANVGSTDNTIVWRFALTGLQPGSIFNQIDIDIHALAANGIYQGSTNSRYFDFKLGYSTTEADPTDWDSAMGREICQPNQQTLTMKGEDAITIGEEGTLVIELTTNRAANNTDGCFFGISGIRLYNPLGETTETPELFNSFAAVILAKDIENQIATITKKNWTLPAAEDGVESVIWPNDYREKISGVNNYFEIITQAEQAKSGNQVDALETGKANLGEYLYMCFSNGAPISFIYELSSVADHSTAYLPINVVNPGNLELELFTCDAISGNTLTLSPVSNNNFAANTAYIVKSDGNAHKYQFIGYSSQKSNTQANSNSLLKGTHTSTTLTAGEENNYYVLQNQYGVLGFYLVAEGTDITVPAGKCYLQLPNEIQDVKYLRFPDGTLTAIDAIDAAKPADAATYDLSGRRVGTMTKGLYIVDGRKVLVK